MRPPFVGRKRTEIVQELRRLVPGQAEFGPDGRVIALGIPSIDACLPQGGLAFGAVHEVRPRTKADAAAALGFITALSRRFPTGGPVVIVTSGEENLGGTLQGHDLHGHGLNTLGLDPARIILVNAKDNKDALWAIEETLRSGVPTGVAGIIGPKFDLLSGQRLHLATGDSGIPLFLLRPPDASGINVATTRWRIGAAPAACDRFDLLTHWRWHVELERCRNGRSGDWLVEFDHAAYRFSLSTAMAHPAFSRRAGAPSFAADGDRSPAPLRSVG